MDETNDKIQKFICEKFNLPHLIDKRNFKKALAERINDLIENDFTNFVNILYRIDVSESKLKETLNSEPGKDAGEMIADLIIERQLQKVKSRNELKNDLDTDEEEKW